MTIRFIAHAGFEVFSKGLSLMIDPWFTSSSFEMPIIEGILPGAKTIDFQIPESHDKVSEFKPDAIFLSHYHTHHSPMVDVIQLATKKPNCLIAGPSPKNELIGAISDRIKSLAPQAKLEFFSHRKKISLEHFVIEAFEHPAKGHLGWIIEGEGQKIIHLADAIVNSDFNDRRLDSSWDFLKDLRPDLLLLSAGGNVTKGLYNGKAYLQEHSILSPFEAARLTEFIMPKSVGVMGVFHHSIWKSRAEFALPSSIAEEQFTWAANILCPSVHVIPLRPGYSIDLNKAELTITPSKKSGA